MIVENRTSDLCGPRLRPCEGCGGMADYAPGEPGWVVARCTSCGRRTGAHANTLKAAGDWNHRISYGARVVTLSELWDLDFGMGDDQTDVAVWIEGRCGTLRAAVLSFGIDMGDLIVWEYGKDRHFAWSRKDIEAEGVSYRLWDKKPEKWERERAPWGKVAWKEARTARAEEMVKEAIGNA